MHAHDWAPQDERQSVVKAGLPDSGVHQSDASLHEALVGEFRDVYRKPGPKYLAVACLFGCASAVAYYVIDFLGGTQGLIGGAQTFRVTLAAACLLVAYVCWMRTGVAIRHYAPLLTTVCQVALSRQHESRDPNAHDKRTADPLTSLVGMSVQKTGH